MQPEILMDHFGTYEIFRDLLTAAAAVCSLQTVCMLKQEKCGRADLTGFTQQKIFLRFWVVVFFKMLPFHVRHDWGECQAGCCMSVCVGGGWFHKFRFFFFSNPQKCDKSLPWQQILPFPDGRASFILWLLNISQCYFGVFIHLRLHPIISLSMH